MYISKLKLKEEMNDDLAEARHYDRKRWYVRKILPNGKKDWKNGFVDKDNQPLYDGTGTYIPRHLRNKIRNEREIYYRKNPHKSVWKTEVNKTDYEIIEEKKNITSLRRIL